MIAFKLICCLIVVFERCPSIISISIDTSSSRSSSISSTSNVDDRPNNVGREKEGAFPSSSSPFPWELPVLPAHLPDRMELPPFSFPRESVNAMIGGNLSFWFPLNRKIPRLIWVSHRVAPRNVSEVTPQTWRLMTTNPAWRPHLYGNDEYHLFMEKYFVNTSILWAFKAINPNVGVSWSDIWRYCALYLFGGFYIDDDSGITLPLDTILTENDTMVLSIEKNDYQDPCYVPHFRLSSHSLQSRYNVTAGHLKTLFYGKTFATFAMFSSARNPLLLRLLETIVDIFKHEYLHRSVTTISSATPRYMKVLCCTGPNLVTATAREYAIIHGERHENVPRVTPRYEFQTFGGKRKYGDDKVQKGDHYMMKMESAQLHLLQGYANLSTTMETLTNRFVVATQPHEHFSLHDHHDHVSSEAYETVYNETLAGKYGRRKQNELKGHAISRANNTEVNMTWADDPRTAKVLGAVLKMILYSKRCASMNISLVDRSQSPQSTVYVRTVDKAGSSRQPSATTYPPPPDRPWRSSHFYRIEHDRRIRYPDFCSFLSAYSAARYVDAPFRIAVMTENDLETAVEKALANDRARGRNEKNNGGTKNIHNGSSYSSIFSDSSSSSSNFSSLFPTVQSPALPFSGIVTADNKEYFLVQDCQKFGFSSWEAFENTNLTSADAIPLPLAQLQALPFVCAL